MLRISFTTVLLLPCLAAAQAPQSPTPGQPPAAFPATPQLTAALADSSMAPPAFVPNVAQSTQQPATGPLRISGGVMAGLLLSHVAPAYPPEAKASGLQGKVVLSALIGRDGRVQQLAVVFGAPPLADAALAAVRQWTWRPYLLNGRPTEVPTTITVPFSAEMPQR